MNTNITDKKELILIALISLALVVYYINFNVNLGIYCSDVYVYLLNAQYFAGTNVHSTNNIFLSPVICFLTSLLFDIGLVDKLAIYIVTGIFAILGNIGLYLLLRLRFNSLLSFTGTIVYTTLALNLTWLANGSLDIPAVTITIWIVYATVLAIKSNPRYYLAVFPLLVIGFFTRYTVGLILPAVVLYYLYENSLKINENDFKFIKKGLIVGIILFIIIVTVILIMGNGNLGFGSLFLGGVGGNLGSTHDSSYNPDFAYYLVNMPSFISSTNTTFIGKTPALSNPTVLSGLVFLILIVGGIIWARRNEPELNREKILGILLCMIALVTFSMFSSTITIILVFFGLYLIGKDSDSKMGYAMICWILAYLIFQSYYVIKVNRYIMPAFPALIYFLMVAVEEINSKIDKKKILPILLIVLFIIQGFAFTYSFDETNEFNAPEQISDYIKSDADNWSDLQIGVYNIRPYFWYLGDNVTGIPNQFTDKIIESNVTYYISNVKQDNLTNYSEITQIEDLYLYKKIN
ncbi:glycosyltransferase family 39 protein [Methanobrevibacter sp.]|uniref:glycosyltransferase family 39 protein n=1 Tax=Methanobrevibacter sp. TaxID=66852 RepID=UPI00388DB821